MRFITFVLVISSFLLIFLLLLLLIAHRHLHEAPFEPEQRTLTKCPLTGVQLTVVFEPVAHVNRCTHALLKARAVTEDILEQIPVPLDDFGIVAHHAVLKSGFERTVTFSFKGILLDTTVNAILDGALHIG